MRPDLEDYEDLNQTEEETPRSRAMSWLVLVVAIGGFAALAYYAYQSGTQSMQDGDVLVVQADDTPIKQQPEDPEGEQFANQDKTIYEVIGPNGQENSVEKLLPEPERPVAVPQEVVEEVPPSSAPTTYVNKNLTDTPKDESPALAPVEAPKAAAPVKTEASAAPVETVKPAPLVVPVPSANVAAVEPKPVTAAPKKEEAGAPTFVNESPVVAKPKKEETKPVVKKEEPKPAAAPKATGGSGQVQLGAFKSEDEANTAWKKIAAKSGGVLGGSPTIVRADLPNGTFYRLRASVSGSPKEACAALSAKGLACFPVK